MEIRVLRPDEYVEALRLAHSVFTYCLQQDISDPQMIDGFENYTKEENIRGMAADKRLTLWGVFAEGRIVGMSAMQSEGHITMLYVYPAFQRRGYGSRLLETMRGYAGTAYGHRMVTLNALPARTADFFGKRGFMTVPEAAGAQLPFAPMQARTPSYAVYEKKPIPTGWLVGTSMAGLAICAAVAVGFMLVYF